MSDTPQASEEPNLCPKCNSEMEKGSIHGIGSYTRYPNRFFGKIGEKELSNGIIINSYVCSKVVI